MKDAVARLTPLGLMVLALLGEGDMHPYEMMRLLRQRRDDRLVTITNGTMYHTVARLERAGLLAEVGVDRDGNRPERTTYALTDAGPRRRRASGCAGSCRGSIGPREFRVALAEAHNLDRARGRRAAARAPRRTRRRSTCCSPRLGAPARSQRGVPDAVPPRARARERAARRPSCAWLDDLIARLDRP